MDRRNLTGQTLSHFRIIEPLGRGGMGEVYRAEDLELGRQVAIKLLPQELAADGERLARFRREARILASLNHTNIASLYQLEQAGDRRFLVMELVEGKTLETLHRPGGLQLGAFFEVAIPLIEAVAAAHDKGITHRDLKPANVLIDRAGRIKVLDFGIAKLQQDAEGGVLDEATQALTRDGQMVGTVPYMSPEQIKGERLDGRSDLFSLGVMLYELATGHYPFEGQTSAELLASILRDDPPPVGQQRQDLPPQLGRIIGRCLEKDPKRRFQSAIDLQNALQDLRVQVDRGEAPATEATGIRQRDEGSDARAAAKRRQEGLIAIALIALFAILFAWWQWTRSAEQVGESAAAGGTSVIREMPLERRLGQLTFGAELEEWPVWSPDGSRIVYAAEERGLHRLVMQSVAGGERTELTDGEFDSIQPAWSPDGESLVFVKAQRPGERLARSDVRGWYTSGGDVWRLQLESGEPEPLIEDAFAPAFSPDGSRIAVYAGWAGPTRIWSTDERGRNPRQLSTDTSEAVTHSAPSWSPDGNKVVYRRIQQTVSDIRVTDTSRDTSYAVTEDQYLDLDPVWSPDGRFIYFSSYRGGGLNIWRLPVDADGRRQGDPQQLTTGAGDDLQLSLRPDGGALAFAVLRLNSDVWVLQVDPRTGEPRQPPQALVATTREDSRASWSPDQTRLAFNSDRSGEMNLWLLDLETGEARQLTHGDGGDYQPRFSPDGQSLVFFSARAGNNDIWKLDLVSGDLTQLTQQPGLDINPFVSPDGRWIAYQSDADGRLEVWLMAADGSGKRAVSSTGSGGHFLVWTDDSRSLITSSAGRILQIDLETGEVSDLPPISSGSHMTFAPDRRAILDVSGHRTLWVYPLDGGEPRKMFEFDNPDIHVDYPVWSADGTQVLFDRAEPQGSDIWVLEGLD